MKRGVWWTIISLFLFSSVTGLVLWDYNSQMFEPIDGKKTEQIRVEIKQGSSLSDVLALLQRSGLEISPTYMRFYLWWKDQAHLVRAGAYYFSPSQTPAEIAAQLTTGPQMPYMVILIKEGFNIWQVAEAIEKSGLATADEFLKLAADPEFAKKLRVPEFSDRPEKVLFPLEGWLFPETYYVEPGQTLENVLAKMVELSVNELRKAKTKRNAQYAKIRSEFGLTDYEFVTLASIVEKETSLDHEKYLVASVFLNRLRKGMKLETDPTLVYTPKRHGVVPTVEDRRNKNNPYNTYEYMGLPPGPICNPGRTSLEAVVGPERWDTHILYFVAKGDGSGGHTFSSNYEDHKKAVQTYLENSNNE